MEGHGVAPTIVPAKGPEEYTVTWRRLELELGVRKRGPTLLIFVIQVYEQGPYALASFVLEIHTVLVVLTTRVVVGLLVLPGTVLDDLNVLAIFKRHSRQITGLG